MSVHVLGSVLSGETIKLQKANLFISTSIKAPDFLLRKGGISIRINRITAVTLTVVLRLIKSFPSKQDFCIGKIVWCMWEGRFSRKETFSHVSHSIFPASWSPGCNVPILISLLTTGRNDQSAYTASKSCIGSSLYVRQEDHNIQCLSENTALWKREMREQSMKWEKRERKARTEISKR